MMKRGGERDKFREADRCCGNIMNRMFIGDQKGISGSDGESAVHQLAYNH